MNMASEMIVRASGSPGSRSGLEMDSFNNKIGLWEHAGSFWELRGRSGPEMDSFNNKISLWGHAGSVWELRDPFGAGNGHFQ